MTSQRAQAYATALKSFRDLKPSKFSDAQMDLFQQTADALFFTDVRDDATADLLATTHAELDIIAENDRLLPETVKRLKDELDEIGPAPVAV
jgi:predicted ATP-grasp superfamily ATP-dependent carboligase